jgi:hypothetical protein
MSHISWHSEVAHHLAQGSRNAQAGFGGRTPPPTAPQSGSACYGWLGRCRGPNVDDLGASDICAESSRSSASALAGSFARCCRRTSDPSRYRLAHTRAPPAALAGHRAGARHQTTDEDIDQEKTREKTRVFDGCDVQTRRAGSVASFGRLGSRERRDRAGPAPTSLLERADRGNHFRPGRRRTSSRPRSVLPLGRCAKEAL